MKLLLTAAGLALAAAAQTPDVTEIMARAARNQTRSLEASNIKGLGLAVNYQKFEDGIWFPVSYGGEFEMRALFFYKRKISLALTNSNFRRTRASSSVTYVSQDR